jgi:acyl-ACP thioesterase
MSVVSQYTDSHNELIRVKAYYIHIDHPTQSQQTNWLKAEILINNQLLRKKVRWNDTLITRQSVKKKDNYITRVNNYFNNVKSSDAIYYNFPTLSYRHYTHKIYQEIVYNI